MSEDVEAVQFHQWKPWHAVRPGTDVTYCGLNARRARRMWQNWSEMVGRCKRCLHGCAK